MDNQRTPLTEQEEALFARIKSRVDAYFCDFEELEGFSVFRSNLERLQRKVTLELRCVCYEYHDSFLLIEVLLFENDKLQEAMERQQQLCDEVIIEAEALKSKYGAMKAEHAIAIDKLHSYYATQERLMRKQWELDGEAARSRENEALCKEHEERIQLLHQEHVQHLEGTRKQLERTKQDELEYMEVQLRLQITSQVSREIGKKLARQQKLCEKHREDMKSLQRRVTSLQDAQRHRQRIERTSKLK